MLGALLAGAVTGLAGVVVHETSWGLPLLAAATVSALMVLPRGRAGQTPFGLGFVLVVLLAVVGRPEGDNAISASLHGYLLMTGGLMVLGLAVTSAVFGEVIPRSEPKAASGDEPSDQPRDQPRDQTGDDSR